MNTEALDGCRYNLAICLCRASKLYLGLISIMLSESIGVWRGLSCGRLERLAASSCHFECSQLSVQVYLYKGVCLDKGV